MHLVCSEKPMVHTNHFIEGQGAFVYENGDEITLNAGDYAHVNPGEKLNYRNEGEKPFMMILGEPKESE